MKNFTQFLKEESQYELAWHHFGKDDRLETKTKSFKTAKHREKFANKISEHPKFHSIYGYRDPDPHELKEELQSHVFHVHKDGKKVHTLTMDSDDDVSPEHIKKRLIARGQFGPDIIVVKHVKKQPTQQVHRKSS